MGVLGRSGEAGQAGVVPADPDGNRRADPLFQPGQERLPRALLGREVRPDAAVASTGCPPSDHGARSRELMAFRMATSPSPR